MKNGTREGKWSKKIGEMLEYMREWEGIQKIWKYRNLKNWKYRNVKLDMVRKKNRKWKNVKYENLEKRKCHENWKNGKYGNVK